MGIISTTDDVFANNQLKVYPNPSSSYIQIQGLQEEANVIIQNIDGQVIRKLITKGSEVDIKDLPNGVYIFDIQNSNVNEKHKVVKI
ncbi:MAG: T9SS type A sorting domain-containing protein [Saprospiraceae bacterium]|nr:T9SS type A sorting domain-containing protein [Saprospiraceae bacterium]